MAKEDKSAETVPTQAEFLDVNSTEGTDEILRRAVEAEKTKGNLRITAGQMTVLHALNPKEEIN